MKKLFTLLLATATLLSIPMLTSCSNDDSVDGEDGLIVDYSNIVINVKVLSTDGQSILNEDNTQDITAVFRDKSYPCQPDGSAAEYPYPSTRYDAPHFYGLCYHGDYLKFGELDGVLDYEGEQLILHWGGDLKPDTITFYYEHAPNPGSKNKYAVAYNYPSFRLNGKPIEGEIIIYKDLPADGLDDGTPRKQMPIKDEHRPLINGVNLFSLNLFRQVIKERQTESIVMSPLSMAYLLGMVANGAPQGSATEGEILYSLIGKNFKDAAYDCPFFPFSTPLFNELFQTLITWASQVDSNVKLELADALFSDNRFSVYDDYVNLFAQYYQADCSKLDFTSTEAVNAINGWCNQKTHGLIPTIIDQIPPTAVAYLFNALYFKAPWMNEFKKENTRDGDFTLSDGSKKKVPLMFNQIKTSYAKTETYTAVSLPFSKGAYVMDVFLPAEGMSIAQLAEVVDFRNVPWQNAEVALTLPRFEVSSDFDSLNSILQALGIHRIFTDEAELSQLSPVDNILISNIFQKARIIINEKGGEAAAVTGAQITLTCFSALPFTANRPFLYCIREVSSDALFFVGTYCGN